MKSSLMKRYFDIFFSLTIIIALSPLFLLIAMLIKMSSSGPVFYKSQRLGKAYKTIYCYKYRTMYTDADQKLSLLLASSPELKEEWSLFQKLKEDPRVYPLGKFLRRTSLDELPQFFNVLLGDLSVVGPRPFDEQQLEEFFKPKADKLLSIRPGITGLWQTSGRNLLTVEERLKLEEDYVDKQSFFLDLWIIIKTIPEMLFSKGAF